ncbi:MAG: hypothetical protein LBI28_07400 [Treponema sp.]|jgi:hypothetical protein|nr:hypothetical protein [Treponema sp.]
MKLHILIFCLAILIYSCSKEKGIVSQSHENTDPEIYEKIVDIIENEYLDTSSEKVPPRGIFAKLSDFYIGRDLSEHSMGRRHAIVVDAKDKNDIYSHFLIFDDEIIYKIAYSYKNIINYIIVDDKYSRKIFETPEGISIGMTYQELKNIIPTIKIYESPYFGYFGRLPSNWKVSFNIGTERNYFPKDDDEIKVIFQDGINYTSETEKIGK